MNDYFIVERETENRKWFDMENKLNQIIEQEYGENVNAADQALEFLKHGFDETEIFVNTDPKFGVTCALTRDEIVDPDTWPEDWEYTGNENDFTTLEDWIAEF